MSRELTREEKAAIRSLVVKWCANYDRECGCLPLDCECYMLGKCWTGAYCRYFREAVLPRFGPDAVNIYAVGLWDNLSRSARFLRRCRAWKKHANRNLPTRRQEAMRLYREFHAPIPASPREREKPLDKVKEPPRASRSLEREER